MSWTPPCVAALYFPAGDERTIGARNGHPPSLMLTMPLPGSQDTFRPRESAC